MCFNAFFSAHNLFSKVFHSTCHNSCVCECFLSLTLVTTITWWNCDFLSFIYFLLFSELAKTKKLFLLSKKKNPILLLFSQWCEIFVLRFCMSHKYFAPQQRISEEMIVRFSTQPELEWKPNGSKYALVKKGVFAKKTPTLMPREFSELAPMTFSFKSEVHFDWPLRQTPAFVSGNSRVEGSRACVRFWFLVKNQIQFFPILIWKTHFWGLLNACWKMVICGGFMWGPFCHCYWSHTILVQKNLIGWFQCSLLLRMFLLVDAWGQ